MSAKYFESEWTKVVCTTAVKTRITNNNKARPSAEPDTEKHK